MEKKKKFVFLAHWVESWNWLLWWIPDLHRNADHRWRWIWLYPVYLFMSFVYLVGRKAYDIVDSFRFNGVEGETYLVRNFGWHFFLAGKGIISLDRIKERILTAVMAAQENGASVIGLGALVKDATVTRGGDWIRKQLGSSLKIPLVHGDTLTAATVVKQAELLLAGLNTASPIFLTGATSKVGRAVALVLAQKGIRVKMFTHSQARFAKITAEAGVFGGNLERVDDLQAGNDCRLWIIGKITPAGKDLLGSIPFGARVINFAVPNPLSPKDLETRPDIYLAEGGLLAYDPDTTSLTFTMRLKPGITYACHAALIVHTQMGWAQDELGPVDIGRMPIVWQAASEMGFSLPLLPGIKITEKAISIPRRALELAGVAGA
ncbi:MAG: hypothetical protein WC619_02460 [Patescibacteria group bacterium]